MVGSDERPISQVRSELLLSAAENANNSLWNYVSIQAWLRVLRTSKVAMLIFATSFGALASWYSLEAPQKTNVIAALTALAGFFPILYVALGLDQAIGYFRGLAGRYRLSHARFSDLAKTGARFDDATMAEVYDQIFADYCRIREEAHTVPQWCFNSAKTAIERGDYTNEDATHTRVKMASSQSG